MAGEGNDVVVVDDLDDGGVDCDVWTSSIGSLFYNTSHDEILDSCNSKRCAAMECEQEWSYAARVTRLLVG